jgi:hypothetical protein
MFKVGLYFALVSGAKLIFIVFKGNNIVITTFNQVTAIVSFYAKIAALLKKNIFSRVKG